MPPSRLTQLQKRVLSALADIAPPWTLTGGAALAGVHLAHRATRDLDLFWHGAHDLHVLRDEVERRLRDDGLEVMALHTSPGFRQLRVADGHETIVVDLVADPVPPIEPPQPTQLANATVLVDTPHEILVNKLCALLGRAEARDLFDVRELLRTGLVLERALRDAPNKDGGFSPLTLAWVLRQPALEAAIEATPIEGTAPAELLAFRDDVIAKIMRAASPDR